MAKVADHLTVELTFVYDTSDDYRLMTEADYEKELKSMFDDAKVTKLKHFTDE